MLLAIVLGSLLEVGVVNDLRLVHHVLVTLRSLFCLEALLLGYPTHLVAIHLIRLHLVVRVSPSCRLLLVPLITRVPCLILRVPACDVAGLLVLALLELHRLLLVHLIGISHLGVLLVCALTLRKIDG